MQEALSQYSLSQATSCADEGDWAKALEWLVAVAPALHPPDLVYRAHCALAKEAIAGGFWGRAEDHLGKALAMKRDPLLERRLHMVRNPAALLDDYQWQFLRSKVDPAGRLPPEKLTPQVSATYTCGQYRAYTDRYQPWSRFLRIAKNSPRETEDGDAALRLAGEFLCRVVFEETPLLRHVDVVVSIPANAARYVSRMMSLPDELAKALSSHFALPFLFDALISEAPDDLELRGLSWRERQDAVVGSMRAGELGIGKGRNVLLVDDITTSGASLREGARLLRDAGAADVYAITLSHTEG